MAKKKIPKRKPKRSRAPRGTGTVFEDKRRHEWVGRVPIGRYASGRTKYTEVRAPTQGQVVERMKGARPPGPQITVSEWADRWLQECSAQPQTVADYAHTVKRWIKPTIGPKRVADLTAADVQNAVAGWELGPNSKRKNLRTIRTMLEAARRARLVPENVAKDARGPKARKVPIKPFTPAELLRIIERAAGRRTDSLFGLMAAIGCRIGEAFALDVADFDPAARLLSITKTYTRKHGVRRTKSENGMRSVRVPLAAVPCLVRALDGRKTGPLFATPDGKRRRQHATAGQTWASLLKRLGLAHRNAHQLRHSVATHAIARGVPLANVARDLGDTVDTIVRTYVHPTDDRDVCGAMEGLLSECKVAEKGAGPPIAKESRPKARVR